MIKSVLQIYTLVVHLLNIGLIHCESLLQDMIENVLEIKDTYVREVMTPLVDVVASDASATLVDFHALWVTHQYSRYTIYFLLS